MAYVAPGFAVVYGVVLLGEGFGAASFAGLVMIVGGSWLAAEGRFPWQARAKRRVQSGTAVPAAEAT